MSEWKLSEGVMPCGTHDIVDVIYPGDITPRRAPAITCSWGDRRTQWKLVKKVDLSWIPWNGGECPLSEDTHLEIKFRDGDVDECIGGTALRWDHKGLRGDIVAYRVIGNVEKPEKPTAQAILRRAADLIEQRSEQRDQPNGEKSMAKTVAAFNTIYGTSLTEVQGWHFMELLKMVRSAYGVYVPDDFEDKVAYAALAAECQSQESA